MSIDEIENIKINPINGLIVAKRGRMSTGTKSSIIREGAVGQVINNTRIVKYLYDSDKKGNHPVYLTECITCGYQSERTRQSINSYYKTNNCKNCCDTSKGKMSYLNMTKGCLTVISEDRTKDDTLTVQCSTCNAINTITVGTFSSMDLEQKNCQSCVDHSREIIDYTNKQFGPFKVLKFIGRNLENEATEWETQCTNCGNIAIKNSGNLKTAESFNQTSCKSCTTGTTWEQRKIRFDDLVGATFSNFEVLSYIGQNEKKMRIWEVQCTNCSNILEKTTNNLTAAKKKYEHTGILGKCKECYNHDIIGQVYGNLTILKIVRFEIKTVMKQKGPIEFKSPVYLCRCTCGSEREYKHSSVMKDYRTRFCCTQCNKNKSKDKNG